MSRYKYVQIESQDGVRVVSFANLFDGKIGLDNSDTIISELDTAFEYIDGGKVIIDLSGIVSMNSGMLGKLIVLWKKLGSNGRPLRFCGIGPGILEELTVTKLYKLFSIESDRAQAMKSLADD